MAHQQDVLGQGVSFPLRVNPQGALALGTGTDDIKQAIHIILGTIPGERVMRPTFGCRAWELVFAPNTPATHKLLEYYVREALEFWEPRIELRAVEAMEAPTLPGTRRAESGNRIDVRIEYEIKETYDSRSIVYPFYILSEDS